MKLKNDPMKILFNGGFEIFISIHIGDIKKMFSQ